MATVPYGEGVPEKEPAARPPDDYLHINATPDEFGGLIAKGTQDAGKSLAQVSNNLFDIAQFQGKVNTDDQVNKGFERFNHIMYGDPGQIQTGQDGNPVLGPDGKPQVDRGFMGLEGRSASDQRATVLKRLQDEINAGRKNLTSPAEQLAYDTQMRRRYFDAEREIGAHTDSQWKVWAGGVNDSGAKQALSGIAFDAEDKEKVAHHTADLINFRVQAAQIKYGDQPEIIKQTVDAAKQEALIARLEAINVKNPQMAAEMADKDRQILGTKYDELANKFRARSDWAVGRGLSQDAQVGGLPTNPSELAGQVLSGGMQPASAADSAIPPQPQQKQSGAAPQNPITVAAPLIGADERRNRDVISGFIGSVGGQRVDPSVTPWCAAFVNAVLRDSGLQGTGSLAARSFLNVGTPVYGPPKMGDVVVFSRGGDPSKGHVGFYAGPGSSPGSMAILGGNQNDKVSVTEYPAGAVLGVRRMGSNDIGKTPQADTGVPSMTKGDAFRRLYASPSYQGATPEQRAHAEADLNHRFAIDQIAADQTAKQRKEVNDASAKNYLTEYYNQLHNPKGADFVALAGKINADPSLEWRTQNELLNMVRKPSGEEQILTFGPGYTDVKNRMLSEPGSEGHIADVAEIYRIPESQLTIAGKHELVTMAGQLKKSPDQYGVQQAKAGLEKYAKSKLSFNDEMLIPGLPQSMARDPQGERVFNAQFIPKFHAAFGKWVAEGKDPFQFLTQENVDKMIMGMRSQREMAEAKMRATNSLGEIAAPAAPPRGANVDPEAWAKLSSQPAALADGTPLTKVVWANALATLAAHPTPAAVDGFNRVLGRKDGADILKQLTGGKGAAGETKADGGLNFTPQEKALYERHLTNLNGPGGVDNQDGSRSSLFVNTFGIDGKTYLIPSVWGGKILTPQASLAQARAEGLDKFPSYATEAEAQARYGQMHKLMERDTAAYLAKHPRAEKTLPEEAADRMRDVNAYSRPGGSGTTLPLLQ